MPEEVIIILYLHTSIDCEIDIDLTSIFGKTLKFKVKQYYNETKIKNINKITTKISYSYRYKFFTSFGSVRQSSVTSN